MNNAHTSFSGVRPQDWGNTLSVCLGLILMLALVLPAWAVDPPYWNGGAGAAIKFPPAPWPSEPAIPANCAFACGGWLPYTRFQQNLDDPRVQDPSNGGTSPQNYVNISSSCIDQTYPSIYYYLYKHPTDSTKDVMMFRWRVEQIAHNYATGPAPGSFGATDPWSSGQWTVLFDLDGDGYRDIAAHLNGSSGAPAMPIDQLVGIYGTIPNQSVDYLTDPSVQMIAYNYTGFIDGNAGSTTNRMLNFNSNYPTAAPNTTWPSGSSTNRWDYGTTRAELVYTNACTEYFVDYQIPAAMLDASALGGPKLTRNTPISMLFCTANSLNNPFQKDCALNKAYIANPNQPGPFGDYISFNDSLNFASPTVDSITASGCGTISLTAKVKDTIAIVNNTATATVGAVAFYYYYDANGDGQQNDAGSTWTFAVNGSLQSGTLNTWTASWNATGLVKGQYLIGVQAVDSNAANLFDDGMTVPNYVNRTFSYLTPAEVLALGTPPANEHWYANPTFNGVITAGTTANNCGLPPPYVSKTVNPSVTTAGASVQFTVTVHNTLNSAPITVSQVSDFLPPGFSYSSTVGGTLGTPATSPTGGATGTVNWTFSPAVSIPASSTRTLIFNATASATVGTFSNTASAATSYSASPLVSEPVQIGVGVPRLTIAKTPSSFSALPGNTITYSIKFSNDSPVDATGVAISDPLPLGLTYVAASCGGAYACSYDGPSRTLTWTIGNLASGEGPYTVTFQATVDNPYPALGAIPNVNTATITSASTAPAAASASVAVKTPRAQLALAKTEDKVLVNPAGASPANRVVYTLSYQNIGDAAAASVVLTDPLPSGFTYVSATGSPTSAPTVGTNGTVTWTIGTLAAGASGSVTVTAQATNPFTGGTHSTTNTASITATGIPAVTDSANLAVLEPNASECTNYFLTNQPNPATPLNLEARLSTAGLTSPSTISKTFTTTTFVEMGKFYQEGTAAQTIIFRNASGVLQPNVTLTGNAYIAKGSNTNMDFKMEVFDFDPGSSNASLLASDTQAFNGNAGNKNFTLVVATNPGATTQLTQGHKLLIVISGKLASAGSATANLTVNVSPITDTTAGYTQVCSLPPPNLVVEKSVSASVVNVTGTGRTLTYTLSYANTSPANAATTPILTDTLPAGVTYSSCSFAGSAFTACAHSSGVVTFSGGAGIPASGSGSVTITVNVANDLTGIASLFNTAALSSALTNTVTATANTAVQGGGDPGGTASLVITKQASRSLLTPTSPDNLVTFTLTAVNAGTKPATGVVVTDALPTTYLNYVVSSTKLNNVTVSPDPVTGSNLSVTVGMLAPGAVATITFDMQVKTPAPNGVNDVTNTAASSYTGCATAPCNVNSNPVIVSISTNPDLDIVKTASLATVIPGDAIEYTLTVRNTGTSAATAARVTDPIPANTVYHSITQTDGFTGSYDGVNNRVVFTLDSLNAGITKTLKFKVTVNSPLPSGATTLPNTATISASNASARNSSASSTANASATLTLSKSGPGSMALPAATLTAPAASGATTLYVSSTSQFLENQYVKVGASINQIASLAGNVMTLYPPGLGAAALTSAQVLGSLTYSLSYENTGTANAASAQLSDPLPASFLYVSASPAATSAPAIGSNGTVSWSLGTLVAGGSGTVQVTVIPTASGSYNNTGTLSATGVTSANATATTKVGGLRVAKTTSTPTSTAGGTANYTLTVENGTGGAVAGVTVVDVLSPGFSYKTGTAIVGGIATEPTFDPADTAHIQPIWASLTVPVGTPPGGGLTITFTANISADAGGPTGSTYQNGVSATTTTPGIGITPFDPLSTTAEDVTVLASGQGLVQGYIYERRDDNSTFNPLVDTPLTNVKVTIVDSTDPTNPAKQFEVWTDSNGYYSRVVPPGSYTVTADTTTGDLAGSGLSLVTGANPSTVTVPNQGSVTDEKGFEIKLTGTLFLDNGQGAGGIRNDGLENGAEPAYKVTGSSPGYAVIVDSNDILLAKVQICPNTGFIGLVPCTPGNWEAYVPSGSGYKAYITNTPPAQDIGQVVPTLTPAAPAGRQFTGGNINSASPIKSQVPILTNITPASGMTLNFGVLKAQCNL